MRELVADVVIVGAGPAGSAAAAFLAESGVDVLVVDRARFPREKICGDGLAPRSVVMLRKLGLEPDIVARGFTPMRRYRIVSSWGDAVMAGMPTYGKGTDYGYVVPRRELDELLVTRARTAGAVVHEGVRAIRCIEEADGSRVTARSDEGENLVLLGRVVIAADGSRGSFSRTILPSERLAPYAVAVRLYMEGVEGLQGALNFFLDPDFLPGYGWIFPGGRPGDPANVGFGIQVSSLRRRPDRLRDIFDRFLGPGSMAWPHLAAARPTRAPATFPMLLDFPRGRRRKGRTLFVGDSANLIDPISGEGVAYALESAEAAAEAVSGALRSGRLADLARYDAAVWRSLSVEFLGAYLLRHVLKQTWGNGAIVRLLQRDERLARGGLGILCNSLPATWLLKPAVWRRALSPGRLADTVRATYPARG